MSFASTPSGTRFRMTSLGPPWNMPQSMRIRARDVVRRKRDPVTVVAPPRKLICTLWRKREGFDHDLHRLGVRWRSATVEPQVQPDVLISGLRDVAPAIHVRSNRGPGVEAAAREGDDTGLPGELLDGPRCVREGDPGEVVRPVVRLHDELRVGGVRSVAPARGLEVDF